MILLRRLSISMIEVVYKSVNSQGSDFSQFNVSVKRIKITKQGFISQLVTIFQGTEEEHASFVFNM